MYFAIEDMKSVNYWEGLQTKEQLETAFRDLAPAKMGMLTGGLGVDPELPGFYQDDEFAEVAAEFKAVADEMKPILKDVLDHIPFAYDKKLYKERAEGKIETFIAHKPNVPLGVAEYTIFLLMALDDYTERIGRGFTVPEVRAAMQALARYKELKEEGEK